MERSSLNRVLILGGGFGGLYTAIYLDKTIASDQDVEVTLVNRENFFLFNPLLHEVAASDLDLTHIVNPIRKIIRDVRFIEGDIESIDLNSRKVVVTHGVDKHHHHDLNYDHLVIALGNVTNFKQIPGLQEKALTMKTLGDAICLRNLLIEHLEEADFETDRERRESLLTFVVAGGGFSGVETVASLNDFVREAVRFYPNLNEQMVRVVLVYSGSVILPELSEALGAYAQNRLAERKVEILVNNDITQFTTEGLDLKDGTFIKTNLLVWTAGISANPLLSELPCKIKRGRILVNEYMEIPGFPDSWALGDCALVPNIRTGKYYPPTAQHAVREAKVLAQNITAAIRGERKRAFIYSTFGELASIGKRTGVARIMGFKFSGFTAWLLWRSIYLTKLPRLEKKIRVLLDWTLDIFFSKDIVQYMTHRAPTVSHENDEEIAL